MVDWAFVFALLYQPIGGRESIPPINVHFIVKGSFFFVLCYDMIMYM